MNVNLTFTTLASSVFNGKQSNVADAPIDSATPQVTCRSPQKPPYLSVQVWEGL